ncbi:hypothetical protein [Marinobacter sp. 3-2]|uniref:hypothetical protein n=1 Tax=Marinobacter sp. 3-2 TaxID=2485141 RepID=UPI0011B1F4FF|nr:hypothetical protein [Marinobacter sp. 3-2]
MDTILTTAAPGSRWDHRTLTLSMLDGVLIALASPRPLVFAVNVNHAQRHPVTSRVLGAMSAIGLGRVVPVDSTRPVGCSKHCARGIAL